MVFEAAFTRASISVSKPAVLKLPRKLLMSVQARPGLVSESSQGIVASRTFARESKLFDPLSGPEWSTDTFVAMLGGGGKAREQESERTSERLE